MSRIFAASGDHLDSSSTIITDVPFSMFCWMKETVSSNGKIVICVGTTGSSNTRYDLETFNNANNQIGANSNEKDDAGGSHGGLLSANTIQAYPGIWRPYGSTFTDHNNRASFLEGRIGAGTGAATTSAVNSIRISGDPLGVNPIVVTTYIAHIALWNVVLSASEINQLHYLLPNQVRVANLVNYWPLLNNQSSEPDYGSGNLPLTVTGTTFSTDNPNIAGTQVIQLMGQAGS